MLSTGTISSQTGLVTGIESGQLISQLVAVEKAPIQRLQVKQITFKQQKSAIDNLEKQLKALQKKANEFDGLNSTLTGASTDEEFIKYTASVEEESKLKLTTQDDAQAGNYSFQIKQLAQGTRLAHGGVDDQEAALSGTDSNFVLTIGDETKTIDITANETSLKDLRDAVNNLDADVKASIINTGSETNPYRLTIAGEETGEENEITISASTTLTGFVSSDFSETQKAQDAQLVIDGIDVQSSKNTISDAIQGVTIELLEDTAVDNDGVTEYETVKGSVELDKQGIKTKINQFLSSFNSLVTFFNSQSYNSETKSSGVLNGDSLILSTQSRLQSLFSDSIITDDGNSVSAFEIGISIQNDGTLKMDSEKLEEVLDEDPSKLRNIFIGGENNDGIAAKFSKFLDTYLDPSASVLDGRKESIDQSVKNIDKQIANQQNHVEHYQSRLQKQFLALEKAASTIQNSQSQLSQLMFSYDSFQ